MEILWNKLHLQRPPYRSWDISVKEYDPRIFIEDIEKILIDFKSLTILNKEAGLLSRLIYRMKSKFRNDKGFKYMEKVNRALLNYLNMSLEKDYKILKEYTEVNNGVISLPSRQTIEYILIKTQGFAKLMCHIESIAVSAGNILKSRLHIGQSWCVAMIAYAIISRIWYSDKTFPCCLLVIYYINIFKAVGISWLPDNYVLPQNLSEWLNVSWINEDVKMLPITEHWNKSIFNLIEINSNNEINVPIVDNLIIKNSKKEVTKCNMYQNQSIVIQDDDIGKPISRMSFENINYKETTYKKHKKMSKNKKNIKRLK